MASGAKVDILAVFPLVESAAMTHRPLQPTLLAAALAALLSPMAHAAAESAADPAPAQDAAKPLERVQVEGQAVKQRPKLKHIMREVDGPKITVTKKTSITKLDDSPTVIDNNLRNLFAHTPGLLVSEQQTPSQLNFSYRGIGNPQEAEYVLLLQDGMPIQDDFIGFPTAYFLPLPQTVGEVQLIRGGSSLLYGPEPAPVVNFISRAPVPGQPLSGYSENVVGSNGLFATFNSLSGSEGDFDWLIDAHYRDTDGPRDNADSTLRGADVHLGYRPNEAGYWALDLHAYDLTAGDPGRMSFVQYQADRDTTPTPFNHNWIERYTAALTNDQHFGDSTELVTKLWGGYHDQASRAAAGFVPPQPRPATTTLQDLQFRYVGLDSRLLQRWGSGNAFTIGVTGYHSEDPLRQFTSRDLEVDRYDRAGTPRSRQDRSVNYEAIFAENVFRFGKWHLVPSVRVEHEQVNIVESVKPSNLTRPLYDVHANKDIPLFGLGFGNDFGHSNETYFNISQGYRPVRYFDIGSPTQNFNTGVNDPDPTHSVAIEAGVHGTPVNGLFYDASLFWINVKDRIETQRPNPIDVIAVNTGDTRHRGFEGQIDYDFLAARDPQTSEHLSVYASVSLLNAKFTDSLTPSMVGNVPAFSPRYLARAGVAWREDKQYKLALGVTSVASQFFQDSNLGSGSGATLIPAKIPQYTVGDFSGDYHLTPQWRVLGGISNLTDRKYYARVFGGGLEPATDRTYYAGVSFEFK